jgi:ATP-binding cassette subfamily F protein 3
LRELELSAPEKKEKKEVVVKEVPAISFEERKEINKVISRIERQIGETEGQISKLEKEIATMDQMLADPSTIDNASLFDRYGKSKKRVEEVMYEWELLHEELDEWMAKRNW